MFRPRLALKEPARHWHLAAESSSYWRLSTYGSFFGGRLTRWATIEQIFIQMMGARCCRFMFREREVSLSRFNGCINALNETIIFSAFSSLFLFFSSAWLGKISFHWLHFIFRDFSFLSELPREKVEKRENARKFPSFELVNDEGPTRRGKWGENMQ